MLIEIRLIHWSHDEIHIAVAPSLWAEVESLRPTGTKSSWAGPFVWVEVPLAAASLLNSWEGGGGTFQGFQGRRALPLAVYH